MWISGSRVFKSCAARKRFPAIELPSIVQRVGVPIRRGGAPGDCAARRALFGFKYPYSKRVGSPVGRAGSSVLRDRAARKRFPAVELPSIIQRVGVPIRRGGAPGDCAARRALFGFKYPYSKRVGSPVGRAGSSVLRDRAARKRFPAVELPSIVQRVGVPIRRGGAPGDCAARRALFGFKYPYSKRVGSPVGRAGSSVLRDRAARKRFPAIELPSNIQRVGVPIRRGGAPGDCAARRALFGFKYPYSKRVGSPVGRAGSSVLRDRAARKRFPAIELPSIVQRVGVPIRRGGAPGDCAARRALFRFQISILQQTSRLSGLEGRLVCLRFVGFTVCCCTCATGWPCRSSRRCRRTCRCPCGWT